MKNEEAIDLLNTLGKDEIVFFVYKVILNCPITHIAEYRNISRATLYKHFDRLLIRYREYENHEQGIAALQELFRLTMPDSFFDKKQNKIIRYN